MEDYGLGAATRTALTVLQIGSRRSGRTSRLIERVQAGDWIVVASDEERYRLERLLREGGKTEVQVRVCAPSRSERAWQFGTNPRGETFFDASWVEQWYLQRVEAMEREFTELQGALSKGRQAPQPFDEWSFRFRR